MKAFSQGAKTRYHKDALSYSLYGVVSTLLLRISYAGTGISSRKMSPSVSFLVDTDF
jgi:hypothetical protein